MDLGIALIINSILLGVGLAMDAFSVSMANGLNNPTMKVPRMSSIAGVYAAFQIAMPLIGWICVHTIVEYFRAFEVCIPWIALLLLAYIGGKMLLEGIRGETEEGEVKTLSLAVLLLQGLATSIDALSVGFTIADYSFLPALISSLIIGIVTFFICMTGLKIGKTFGTKLAGKASVLGGMILIAIGLEIFIKGIFF